MPKRIRNVGLLMPLHISVCNTTPTAISEGALSYAQEHEHLRLHHISYSDMRAPLPLPPAFPVDGIISFVSPPVPSWVEQLLQLNCPVVSTSSDPLPHGVARVYADSSPATSRIVAHFAEMKLKNVGVIAQKNVAVARARTDLFKSCARDSHLNFYPFETDCIPLTKDGMGVLTDLEGAEKSLIEYLKKVPKPIGILSFYDILGVHTVEIAQQLGIRVPHDIAVVSAVDTIYCRSCRPQLSAMHAPFEKVGYEAMAVLDRMMAGAPAPRQPVTIPMDQLIIRGSSRLPAESMDLEQARQFILKNAHHGVTVNDVLDLVPVSRPTFEKRFKARFGSTPGREIRRVRTEYVKRVLETTDLSITAIAALCCFSDVNKLNIFFKREVGTTPGKYRRSSRDNIPFC